MTPHEKETETVSLGLLIVGAHPSEYCAPRDPKDEGSCRSKPSNTNTCDAVEKILYIVIQLLEYRVNACSDRWYTSGDFAKRIRHSRTQSDLIRQTYVIG